ncbi:unnamed protein product, partial [Ectocarpus sp. 12 AP-2014]
SLPACVLFFLNNFVHTYDQRPATPRITKQSVRRIFPLSILRGLWASRRQAHRALQSRASPPLAGAQRRHLPSDVLRLFDKERPCAWHGPREERRQQQHARARGVHGFRGVFVGLSRCFCRVRFAELPHLRARSQGRGWRHERRGRPRRGEGRVGGTLQAGTARLRFYGVHAASHAGGGGRRPRGRAAHSSSSSSSSAAAAATG